MTFGRFPKVPSTADMHRLPAWKREEAAKEYLEAARALWDEGLTAAEIGEELGRTRAAINALIRKNRRLFARRQVEEASESLLKWMVELWDQGLSKQQISDTLRESWKGEKRFSPHFVEYQMRQHRHRFRYREATKRMMRTQGISPLTKSGRILDEEGPQIDTSKLDPNINWCLEGMKHI